MTTQRHILVMHSTQTQSCHGKSCPRLHMGARCSLVSLGMMYIVCTYPITRSATIKPPGIVRKASVLSHMLVTGATSPPFRNESDSSLWCDASEVLYGVLAWVCSGKMSELWLLEQSTITTTRLLNASINWCGTPPRRQCISGQCTIGLRCVNNAPMGVQCAKRADSVSGSSPFLNRRTFSACLSVSVGREEAASAHPSEQQTMETSVGLDLDIIIIIFQDRLIHLVFGRAPPTVACPPTSG